MFGADILQGTPGASARGLVVRTVGGATGGVQETAPGPGQATTATKSRVANANADTLLLAANVNRIAAIICNDPSGGAGANLLVSLSATAASATSFTVILTPNNSYIVDGGFTGQIRAICPNALGNAQITEITP